MSAETVSDYLSRHEEDRVELFLDNYEELGSVLEEIKLVQCSIDGVYHALENADNSKSYSRDDVEKMLDGLVEMDLLKEYKGSCVKMYQAKYFTKSESLKLEEEVKISKLSEQQAFLPNAEDVIPGVQDIS